EGAVAVGALQAQTVQAFVGDALPFVLSGGRIDLAMEYRFSAARGANLELDATLPRIAAQELGLRARGVDEDWINVPGALVENARLSLAGRELAVEAVRATGVRATLWREADGTLNLARMLASPADADADADAAADGESAITTVDDAAWTYTVSRFELREGEATLQDRTVAPAATFRLQPLSLTAEDLGQDLAQPVPVTLETTVNGAAPLRISGTVVPDTFAAALDVDIAQLPLRELQSYLPTLPALRIRSGEVAGKGALTLRAQGDPGPGIEFSGAGSLSGFAVDETTDGRELLSWRRVSAEGLRYTAGPDAVSIRTLAVHAPSARVAILPDQSINFANALGAGAAGGSTPGPALKVDVDRIVIDAGRMGFSDFSIEPNFSADIEALRGTIRGVSTAPGSVAKLELAGHVVNRHSPVEISGETDFAAFDRHTDVRMAFRNIELPIFNPYSGRFAGYAIAKGKLSTELHYRIDDRALLADHHVVVDQLEWGEATDSQDKVTLPVRLATSLLKDRHGVIDLDLPISGTLDDPKFRIGPVVWQIIVNIVTRAVTAPFALLGSLFAGAEDAQFVDFAPGSAELSAGAAGGLGALAQALSEKVELKLDVPAGPAGEVDANALRERGFREALAALAGGDAAEFDYDALDADDRLDLLKRLYRQQFGSRAKPPDAPEPAEPAEDATRAERHEARDAFEIDWLESELRPRYAVDPQALAALGQARAAAVQEALLADGSIDAARVFVALDLAAAPHEDVVRMELQLK
ncbi:MAG TPA: DUF748 domain-containing protein, partial [Luteimonas sp.]|nr:DUF748 domain-containing protein [Luteimonas sp.]